MTEALILSQNARGILAPIARLLGYVINGIYELLYNLFHVQNVAVTIIIFTIVIYWLTYSIYYFILYVKFFLHLSKNK